jgi:thiol-disulfide isomerase/thioredoxin
MHRKRSRFLHIAFTLVVLCSPLLASIPPFSARSLDGEFVTNDSLRGRVVLVQFWTTWCPWCRRDQPMVDDLESRYADKGLVVLAVNVGESEEVVRNYLSARPRSCHVLLNSSVNLASRLGARGFPTYVVLDSSGSVVARASGSQEESWFLNALSKAGLSARRSSTIIARSNGPRDRNSPMMISVPSGPTPVAAKPRQKTVFLLASGERLESDNYTIDSTAITVTIEARKRTIALAELNKDATKAANKERGITLAIPDTPNQIVLSF